MGSTTTSSTASSSGSFIGGEKDYLSHKGKDTEGITEYFQYHDQFLSKLDVKLTYSDKFFREAFRPMHLMNFKFFNNVLDKFVDWCKDKHRKQRKKNDGAWQEFDAELLPYELFIEYFTDDQNHLVQIFDKNSPMRSVFRFGTALTRTVKRKKSSDDAMDEKLNELVEQVFRESMLDPSTMNFLSDDKQNQFLKESIKATMQLERSNSEGSKQSVEDQKTARFVDLFSLRVLSLLACRGTPTEKAKFLAKLSNEASEEPVRWDNPRLRKAIRFILYFSSVMPLKFLSVNQDEDVFNKILSQGKYGQSRKGKRMAVAVHAVDKQFLWTEDQIEQTEQRFDDVLELFMEEQFLQALYPVNTVSLSYDDFARRFYTGKSFIGFNDFNGGPAPKPVDWIFSPSAVSSKFSQLLKGTIREECFLIEKIDWQDETNEIVSLESYENADMQTKGPVSAPFA